MDLGALSILHMAGRGQGNTGSGASGHSGQPSNTASIKGPGRWTYQKPTTSSKASLDYKEFKRAGWNNITVHHTPPAR